jgi:outer membrane immunogenic protein
MFFKVVTTTAAAFLVAGSAFAADVVSYQDPTPVAPLAAAYDWSGFYVGINAGIGGGTAKHPFSIVDTAGTSLVDGSVNLNGNGFTGGVQAGYNVQSGALVWGVEGDIQYAHIDNRVSGSFGGGALDLEAGTRLNWFGTLPALVRRSRIASLPMSRVVPPTAKQPVRSVLFPAGRPCLTKALVAAPGVGPWAPVASTQSLTR